MKELSIEEKAKRYDEALIRGSQLWESDAITRGSYEYMFPELVEIDDEKVRKWIKNELESKYVVDNIVNNVMADKALAWLEKKGEQKPIEPDDLIEESYQQQVDDLIDMVTENSTESEENEIEIPFGAKDSELQEVTYYIPKGFHAEIDDDKVVIKKGEKPTAWSEEDGEKINKIKTFIAQCNGFNKKNRETVFNMLDSLGLQNIKQGYHEGFNDGYSACYYNTWKPSDEQMKLLREVQAALLGKDCHNRFVNFMYELKRLKEE